MDHMSYALIVPAAGRSMRFVNAGYRGPKGLIHFKWRGVAATMIEHVLQCSLYAAPTVVCKTEDRPLFEQALPHVRLVTLTYSMGQADTAGHAVDRVPRREDILIINCDNAFECDLNEFVRTCRKEEANCGAVVFQSNGERRYGYVDGCPTFTRGVEKDPISPFALAGAFYFCNPAVYEHAYRQMLVNANSNASTAEQYISGMFQHVRGPKFAWLIERSALHEWGTPEDLQADTTVELESVA